MNFFEAYELLKDGHCVGRTEWEVRHSGQFMFIYEQVEFPMVMRVTPQPNVMNFQPKMEDLEATDWFIKKTIWNQSAPEVVSEVVEFVNAGISEEAVDAVQDVSKAEEIVLQ